MKTSLFETGLLAACLLAGMSPGAMGAQPNSTAENIPLLVRDENAGDWVVDRFVGNNTAGSIFWRLVQTRGSGKSETCSDWAAMESRYRERNRLESPRAWGCFLYPERPAKAGSW